MARYSTILRDQNEVPISGAVVSVINPATGALATLTDDSSTSLQNPITTGPLGDVTFNTADNVYRLEYRVNGIERRVDDVIVGLPSAFAGPAGPAFATYFTLANFKAASTSNAVQVLQATGIATGLFYWETANAPYTADNVNVIKADSTALSVGAWVRQGAGSITFTPSGAGALPAALQTVLQPLAVHVHLFRLASDPDDTLAATRALATGYPVRYVAGKGSDTDGAYLQGQVSVPAGAVIFGDGPQNTILRDLNGTGGTNGTTDVFGMFAISSSAYNTTVDNIRISDLQMQGLVAARAFREHRHLIYARGVKGLLIERCKFFGWRGDAIYIGGDVVTPMSSADYRHNFNILIHNNVFDGDTADNRQAVSILDCVDFKLLNNEIRNTTRSDMPGAVDFEPSPYAEYVLRNITVAGNQLENIGGNVGAIAIHIPSTVTTLPVQFLIANNTFKTCSLLTDISINMLRTFTSADRDQAIIVTGNRGFGGVRPFIVYSAKGVQLDQTNVWDSYSSPSLVGYTALTTKPYGCSFKPTLKNVALGGMQVYRGDHLTLGGSYTDTGTVGIFFEGVAAAGDGTSYVTIRDLLTRTYNSTGSISGTTLTVSSGVGVAAGQAISGAGVTAGTTVVSGSGTTWVVSASQTVASTLLTFGIIVSTGVSANHALTPATNRLLYDTCVLNGLVPTFPAQDARSTATLVAGTVTVAMLGVASGSHIQIARQVDGGTVGASYSVTRSAGASFTITAKDGTGSTQAADTSTLTYRVGPAL